MDWWKSSNSGFTLVEVLLALTMVVAVSLGVIQMVMRASQIEERAHEHFIAVNAAREGLELVRAVRDTNWFSQADRSQWITDAMCGQFSYDIQQFRGQEAPGGNTNSRLYIAPNGEWNHDASGEETRYGRVLDVDCSEKDGSPARVTVTARVVWDNRGQEQEVVLKERLYNWLP